MTSKQSIVYFNFVTLNDRFLFLCLCNQIFTVIKIFDLNSEFGRWVCGCAVYDTFYHVCENAII